MIADVVDPSNGIQTYIEGMTGEIAEWDAELQTIGEVKFSHAILSYTTTTFFQYSIFLILFLIYNILLSKSFCNLFIKFRIKNTFVKNLVIEIRFKLGNKVFKTNLF